MLILFLLLVLILSILSINEPTNYYQISEKHDQTSINLTRLMYLTLWANFWITLDLMKLISCVPLLNIEKKYNKTITYVNELILTFFTLLDINCKKL